MQTYVDAVGDPGCRNGAKMRTVFGVRTILGVRTIFGVSTTAPGLLWHPREDLLGSVVSSPLLHDFSDVPSSFPQPHPWILPSFLCLPHFWHGSCSWSLPFPLWGAQISLGKEEKCPSSPAESLLTIWGIQTSHLLPHMEKTLCTGDGWAFSHWQKNKKKTPWALNIFIKTRGTLRSCYFTEAQSIFRQEINFFSKFPAWPLPSISPQLL